MFKKNCFENTVIITACKTYLWFWDPCATEQSPPCILYQWVSVPFIKWGRPSTVYGNK